MTNCYQLHAVVQYLDGQFAVQMPLLNIAVTYKLVVSSDESELPLQTIKAGVSIEHWLSECGGQTGVFPVSCGLLIGELVLPDLVHPVLMSLFKTQPISYQQVLVVGSDYNDNLVFGSAGSDVVKGPKLKLITGNTITNNEDANTVAANTFSKLRMMLPRGEFLMPANLMLQQYDVIQAHDDVANQEKVSYRVVKFKLTYDNMKGEFTQSGSLISV